MSQFVGVDKAVIIISQSNVLVDREFAWEDFLSNNPLDLFIYSSYEYTFTELGGFRSRDFG